MKTIGVKELSELLHKSRSIQCFLDCGEWYITDDRNLISEKNSKLEKIGRRLKVLRPYEELDTKG